MWRARSETPGDPTGKRAGLGRLLVLAGAVVVSLVGASPAWATNANSVSGDESTECAVRWTASTVLDTSLTNDDATYPGLMLNLAGEPVDYSNGGYISEVRPEYGDAGIFEINHWYTGSFPSVPAVAATDTPVNWRLPISTDHAITGATLTMTIPRGSNFVVTSGANIAAWGAPYNNYTWTNPTIAPASDDGLTWTVYLGDLAAATGVVVQFSGTVPAGTILSEHSVATAELKGAYAPGSASCPTTPPTTTGNGTTECQASWVTDATLTVADRNEAVGDVTREQAVSPELGDPGKFGIDGWSTVSQPGSASLFGRFVLATDEPMSDIAWVLQMDPNIEAPAFSVSNPAPGWRVDNLYPTAVAIDAGVWDAEAHTMTYHLTMPAGSSVMVSYSGTAVDGSYVSGAAYTNTSALTGTYPAGTLACATTPTPSVATPVGTGSAAELAPTGLDPATAGGIAVVGGALVILGLLAGVSQAAARRRSLRG